MSCSDSTGPGSSDNTGDAVLSGTLGSGGGTIASVDISITSSARVFGSDTGITVYETSDDQFGASGVSETYRIEGIPETFSGEIEFSITFDGTLSGNSFIALGTETFITSIHETAVSYTLLPATESGGKLTAVLSGDTAAAAKISASAADSDEIRLKAVSGYGAYITPESHFAINYPAGSVTSASAENLGQYLEEAYTTIADIGFSCEKRTNWPVTVTVKPLESTLFGASSNSVWGDNYGYLEFNSVHMNDDANLRITAGHEFFHFAQALYDPSNRVSKAKFEPPHLWLDEACSVWIEKKFTENAEYVPPTFNDSRLAVYDGVVAGIGDDAGKHGYGIAPMIEYLTDEYGESILPVIYQHIEAGENPLDAVIHATDSPEVWWEQFMRRFTLGEIYNLGLANVIGNNSGLFQIGTDSDTLAVFSAQYPDLSGKYFIFRLDYPYIKSNTRLELSTVGGVCTISAFKFRNDTNTIAFLGTGIESLTVPDLQQLTEAGWHIAVLVSSSRNVPPYTGSSAVTLTGHVINPSSLDLNAYSRISVGMPSVWRSYTLIEPDGKSSDDGAATGMFFYNELHYNLEGQSLLAYLSEPYADYTKTTDIRVDFSADFQKADIEIRIQTVSETYNYIETTVLKAWDLVIQDPAELGHKAQWGVSPDDFSDAASMSNFSFDYEKILQDTGKKRVENEYRCPKAYIFFD